MFTIRATDLENEKSYEDEVESLTDYHSKECKVYSDFPPFENQALVDCLDLSFGALLPVGDGEDFFYQYINKPIFSGKNFDNRSQIGCSYKDLFNNLPNINLLRFMQRCWRENRRVNIKIEVLKDEVLMVSLYLYYIRNKNNVFAIGKAVDNALDLQAEEDKLLNESFEGIILTNKNREILLRNDQFFKIIGLSEEELLDSNGLISLLDSFFIINSEITSGAEFREILDLLYNHELTNFTFEATSKDISKNDYYRVDIIPMIYRGQEVLRISIEDITDSKLQEILSMRLDETLDIMQRMAGVAVSYYYFEEKKMHWTGDINKILENENGELDLNDPRISTKLVSEDNLKFIKQEFSEMSVSNPIIEHTIPITTPKGNVKYLHQYFKGFYDEKNELKLLVSFNEDVTETQKELEQKEVLVKEVNHRVKNNLQIILSLLNLDLRYHSDNPWGVLEDTRARLNYLATLHEKIYKSPDLTEIDIKDYLSGIVRNLISMNNSDIVYKENFDKVLIDLDLAVPLGLIVTEITNNVIKYAFSDNEKGHFFINFKIENGMGVLDCWDDGVGFPKDFDINNTTSFGLTIIQSLTSQINGEMRILPYKGAHCQIRFPLKQEKYYKNM